MSKNRFSLSLRNKIFLAMEMRGWKAEITARRAGFKNASTLRNFLNGTSQDMMASGLRAISEALGVSIDWLTDATTPDDVVPGWALRSREHEVKIALSCASLSRDSHEFTEKMREIFPEIDYEVKVWSRSISKTPLLPGHEIEGQVAGIAFNNTHQGTADLPHDVTDQTEDEPPRPKLKRKAGGA